MPAESRMTRLTRRAANKARKTIALRNDLIKQHNLKPEDFTLGLGLLEADSDSDSEDELTRPNFKTDGEQPIAIPQGPLPRFGQEIPETVKLVILRNPPRRDKAWDEVGKAFRHAVRFKARDVIEEYYLFPSGQVCERRTYCSCYYHIGKAFICKLV